MPIPLPASCFPTPYDPPDLPRSLPRYGAAPALPPPLTLQISPPSRESPPQTYRFGLFSSISRTPSPASQSPKPTTNPTTKVRCWIRCLRSHPQDHPAHPVRTPLLHIPKTSEYPPPAVRPSSTTITPLAPAPAPAPITVPAHSHALEHPVPCPFHSSRSLFPPIPTPWNTPRPLAGLPSPCRSSEHPTIGMFQRWLVSPASKIFYTTYSFYSTTMRSSYSLLFTLFYKRNIPILGCFLPSCTPPQKNILHLLLAHAHHTAYCFYSPG